MTEMYILWSVRVEDKQRCCITMLTQHTNCGIHFDNQDHLLKKNSFNSIQKSKVKFLLFSCAPHWSTLMDSSKNLTVRQLKSLLLILQRKWFCICVTFLHCAFWNVSSNCGLWGFKSISYFSNSLIGFFQNLKSSYFLIYEFFSEKWFWNVSSFCGLWVFKSFSYLSFLQVRSGLHAPTLLSLFYTLLSSSSSTSLIGFFQNFLIYQFFSEKKWVACTNLVVLVLHLVVLVVVVLLLHLLDWILPKLSYLSILQWEVCCVHQLPDCCWELMKSLFWSRNSIPTKAFLDKFSEVTLTMIQVFWSNIDDDSRIRELMKSLFWSRNWIPTKAFLEKQFYKIGRANRSQQMKDRYSSKRQIKET